MNLLERFQKISSSFSKIATTNYFSDKYAKGFTKKMESTQQTGSRSKFGILNKIIKYKS